MLNTAGDLDKDTVKGLRELIDINIDSSKGFTEAAEKVESGAIATYFRQCGARREQFARELRRAANIEDGDGSGAGAAHRWWINLRGTVQSGDEHAMLAEAERGEDAIKRKYEEALKANSVGPLSDALHEQYASIKQDHDTIRDMREARE